MRTGYFFLVLLISSIMGVAGQNFAAGEDATSAKVPRTGVYFDRHFYAIGQKAYVIIVDKNLNRHYDAIDSYSPVRGLVSLEIDDSALSDAFAIKVFRTSFKETGPHTGIFKALLKIPSTDELGDTIKGKELRINYRDIHNHVIWHDTANIR